MKQVLNWGAKASPGVGAISGTRVWTPEIIFTSERTVKFPSLFWNGVTENQPLWPWDRSTVFSNGSFFKTWSQTTAQVPREKAGYFHFSVSKTSGFCNVLSVGVGSDREVVRGKTADSEFSFHVVPATNSPRGCDSALETAVRQGGT